MMHSNPADALVCEGAATAEQRAGSTADAGRAAAGVVSICQLLMSVHGERLDDGGRAVAPLHRVSTSYPTTETHKQQNERQQQVYAFCSGCAQEAAVRWRQGGGRTRDVATSHISAS